MKKFVSMLCVVAVLSVMFVVPVSAAEITAEEPLQAPVSALTPAPRLYQHFTMALNTSSYTEVKSWGPWLDVKLVCVNSALNANAITFRVLDQNGLSQGEKACNPSAQVEFDLSGGQTYTVYAKTNWSNETVVFTLSDGWP